MDEKEFGEIVEKLRVVAEMGGDSWVSLKRIVDTFHTLAADIKQKGEWPPTLRRGIAPGSAPQVKRRSHPRT